MARWQCKQVTLIRFVALVIVSAAAAALLVSVAGPTRAADDGSAFKKLTVDFGIVCSDVQKSIAFYRDVVGCKQQSSFSVSAKVLGDAGLTDYKGADIQVMTLGDGAGATNIKLMQFKGTTSKRADQGFIHSTYGLSYMTVFVNDMNAALARARAAGVKPLSKGPADLGNGAFLALIKDPDGNFIELVGPKK